MTVSVKHGGGSVMALTDMAARGTGSLVFTDYVTADGNIRMNAEGYKVIFTFSQVLLN